MQAMRPPTPGTRHLTRRAHHAAPLGVLALCALLAAACRREAPPPPPAAGNAASPVAPASSGAYDADAVLVRVGDVALTRGMADALIDSRYHLSTMTNVPASKAASVHDRALAEVVDQFVARTLLLKEADRQGIAATDEEVNDAHRRIMARMTKAARRRALESRESDAQLRRELATGIRAEKLMGQAIPPIGEPSETELKAFVDEYRERLTRPERVDFNHILLSVQASDTVAVKDARKAQAEAILKQLIDGGDFAAAAQSHSACPSRQNGGHFERPLARDQLVRLLRDEAAADRIFKQEVGAVGPVVETPYGYHIAKLAARHAGGVPAGEELNQAWKAFMRTKATADYLAKLRQEIPVVFPTRQAPVSALR